MLLNFIGKIRYNPGNEECQSKYMKMRGMDENGFSRKKLKKGKKEWKREREEKN